MLDEGFGIKEGIIFHLRSAKPPTSLAPIRRSTNAPSPASPDTGAPDTASRMRSPRRELGADREQRDRLADDPA
eukprot:7256515-Pyramimonas_sp.AAC.1